MRTYLVFGDFWSPPHLIFIASCIPKILLLNTFHLPKFLNICSWSGDVEVNAKACQFDTWRPMCDITHFGRINVGKNTCGKIGEEVLMRSFSLGSHRSSQPSSTRNSWLFGYVNRGRDAFWKSFQQLAKGVCEIWYLLCIIHHRGCQIHQKTKMINGIMLVVLPQTFLQVSLWRCNFKGIDWLVVPGAWVANPQMPTAARQWHSEG